MIVAGVVRPGHRIATRGGACWFVHRTKSTDASDVVQLLGRCNNYSYSLLRWMHHYNKDSPLLLAPFEVKVRDPKVRVT